MRALGCVRALVHTAGWVGPQGNKSDGSGRYFQTKINGNIGNSAVTSSIEEVTSIRLYMCSPVHVHACVHPSVMCM